MIQLSISKDPAFFFHSKNGIRAFYLFCTMAIALVMLTSTAIAEVTDVSMSPENPSPGDTVTVTGKASPGEVMSASVSFEETQDVSDGSFSYSLSDVTIPEGSDSFGLRATGVDDLDVEVKVPILGYVSIPGNLITINGNVASFGTGKIKSGTYDIKLSGSSGEDQVTLSFTAKASITADADGNFVYTYNTDNMPEGDYNINIGNVPLSLDLGGTEDGSSSDSTTTSSTSKRSSGGSSRTGTELKIVDAENVGAESTDNDLDNVDEDTVDKSMPDDPGSAIEDTVQENYVEGFELSSEDSGIMNKLPDLGVTGLVVGVLCLSVMVIGYRKNKYR